MYRLVLPLNALTSFSEYRQKTLYSSGILNPESVDSSASTPEEHVSSIL